MTHLDTSFLILALGAGTSEADRLDRLVAAGEPLGISAPAWAEFNCGPVSPTDLRIARRLLGTPTPLDADAAVAAAELFNRAGRRRGSMVDCMIAAVAVQADAALATSNSTDFERLAAFGLRIARA